MPYFVVHALDAPGMADVRSANRAAHRARLRNHDHALTVRIGGPLLDDAGEMCGTTLIIEAETRAHVVDFIDNDPYAKAGLYADVRIHAFSWGLTDLEDA